MNLNITPPDQILEELAEIDKYLNITVSEQIEEVVMRGNDLAVYMSRSGKLLADAKFHLNDKMKDEVFETLRKTAREVKASHTAVNQIIKSLCKEEQYLVDWCERVNRSCTHNIDWCRTLISKAKSEMQYSGSHSF